MNAVAKASATAAGWCAKIGQVTVAPIQVGSARPPNAPNVTHASPTCASLDCQGWKRSLVAKRPKQARAAAAQIG